MEEAEEREKVGKVNMKNLTNRPFEGEKDLHPVMDVMSACEADEIPIYDWHKAGERNTRLWEDADGVLKSPSPAKTSLRCGFTSPLAFARSTSGSVISSS
mgnify:CR=1 FL=1